jgi:HEPN domain-containing protein
VDTSKPVPKAFRSEILKRGFLPLAIEHTRKSLDTAQQLLDAGFPSAAFVWATRSAEVFMREALLFPLWYEETGDVRASFSEVRDFLGSGRWSRSIRRVREAYGLIGEAHNALTDSGEDAFVAWTRDFVRPRGEIVHGRAEADEAMATKAIAFAERMREWFTLRVISSEAGPLAGTLREVFEHARALYETEQAQAHEPAESED